MWHIFFVLVLFAANQASFGNPTAEIICGEGQYAANCGCDLTCSRSITSCSANCTDYKRCFCYPGYVRQTDEPDSICVHSGLDCFRKSQCSK